MNRVYIYKTNDGTPFDVRADAFRYERITILQEMFSTTVMPQDERDRMIGNILDKFDMMVEKFEAAHVMDPDDDE